MIPLRSSFTGDIPEEKGNSSGLMTNFQWLEASATDPVSS